MAWKAFISSGQSWRIKANTFFMQRYMDVDDFGVTFCETAITGGKRRFRFEEIECVCISPEDLLSFQVGTEVFSLPIKQNKRKHQEAVSALISGLTRTAPAAAQ